MIEKGRPRGQQLGPALVKMTSGHRSIGQSCFAFTLKKLSGTFHNDKFHMKAAGNIEEIKELLEADQEYIYQDDGLMFSRKRNEVLTTLMNSESAFWIRKIL